MIKLNSRTTESCGAIGPLILVTATDGEFNTHGFVLESFAISYTYPAAIYSATLILYAS